MENWITSLFVVFFMCCAGPTLLADPPTGSGDGWQVIPELTDEFEGTALDSNKWWNYNPGWLGREPGYFSPNNVTVSDGKLHLAARVETLPNLPAGYNTFTTAAVKGKTLVKYGYYEIRCRPMKSKASSAFWFYRDTPQEWTEIDVFEICGAGGSWNNTYNMNVHHFYSPASSTYFNNSQTWRPPFVMADEYHVYALEWNKDVIRWWVDGTVMRQIQNTHWHQPLHMNFDSETFPTWFGLPDPATLPSTFSIEYVRSWSSPTQVAWTASSQASSSESGTMTVTASLSSIASEDVTVPFSVSGSATASDYTITPSPIIIPAGQTTGTATITIIADNIDEPNETVILTMGPPTNATKSEVTIHTATIPGALSVIGSWTYNGTNASSNTWTTAGSWAGGNIADGANSTASFILDITGARTITLGGNRTIGGILFTDTASSHNLTISGNTLTLDVTTGPPLIDVTQSDRTLTIDSIIAGNDGLTKTGLGTLAISGSNTYTGATTVTQGTLNVLDNTNGIKNSTSLSIAAGATVNTTQLNSLMPGVWTIAGTLNKTDNTGQDFYNGVTLNNGTISGSTDKTDFGTYFWAGGSITANGSTNTINAVRLGFGGGTANTPLSTDALSISSILGGTNSSANSGSLTKNGAGTLTLSGNNMYTGATTINAGTLHINGSTSASSAVTVNGGDLGGTGTVGGSVTVATTGNLAPGVSAGTLNITGNLNISAMASGAGRLKFDLGALAGTNDRIAVGGTLALGTFALDDLAVTNLGGLQAGTYTLITSTGWTGAVDGSTVLIATGFNGKLQTNGNNLELIVTAASPYVTWSGSGVAFDADTNNDGVDNGMAWLLGATHPSENAADILPQSSSHAETLRLTFRCLKSSMRGGTLLKIQTSSDLGVTDPWVTREAAVPDTDSTVSGVIFDTTDDGNYVHVIADIPASGSKLFARLSAVVNAPESVRSNATDLAHPHETVNIATLKHLLSNSLLLATITSLVLTGAHARTWTSADGARTFEGELLTYDPTTGTLSVTLAGGKEMKFTQDKLSAADIAFLKEKGKMDAASADKPGPPLEGTWTPIPELTDEFEERTLDSKKWHDHNPGWKGREPGFFSKKNVSVSDGKLHLTSRVETLPDLPKGFHTFTTAAVKSLALVKYGYFEMKCRPMKSQASSAFWFYHSTPEEWTEIDVFEICGAGGKWNNSYNMTVHVFHTPTEKKHWYKTKRWDPPFVMADEYHVYALEWNKDVLRWWMDGKVVHEMKNTHWHQALHMNFDSETFPDWFGLPDKASLPATFSIEYIRSWSRL